MFVEETQSEQMLQLDIELFKGTMCIANKSIGVSHKIH